MPEFTNQAQVDAFLDAPPGAAPPTGTTNMLSAAAAPAATPGGLPPIASQADVDAFLNDSPATRPLGAHRTFMHELRDASSKSISGVGQLIEGLPFDPAAYKAKNEVPGVPLDPFGGGPTWLRAKTAMIPDKASKLKYLQGELGPEQVREDNRGGFIIRENRPGGPVDVTLDEYKLSFGDLGELAGDALLQTVGAGLFTKLARMSPLINRAMTKAPILTRAATASIGAGAGELVKDKIIVEPIMGVPVRWKDALRGAAIEATVNMGADLGMAGVGKGIMRLISPLGRNPTKVAIDGVAAERFFMENFRPSTAGPVPMAEEPLLMVGERVGSPGLINAQAMTGAFPWARRTIEGAVDASMKRKLALQDSFAGIGPDAVFGNQRAALDALEPIGGEMQRALHENLAFPVRQAAINEAQSIVDQAATRITNKTISSTKPYQASLVLLEDAKNKALQYRTTRTELYDEAKQLLGGGQNPVVPTGNLAARAAAWVEANAPSFKQVVEKDTGLKDEAGNAIVATEEVRKQMEAFAPKATRIARELASIPEGTNLSLDHLISMRNTIDDGIKEVRAAVPDLDTRDFVSLRAEMTKTIHEGIAALGPEAKAAYDAAEGFVRQNAPRFQLPGVEKLYHNEANPSAWLRDVMKVSSDDRANQLYFAAKEFYGEGTPQWKMIKSVIRDDVLSKSLDVDGRIDGKAFVGSLVQFARTNKQVFDEVFPDAPELGKEARKAWAGSVFLESGKLDPEEAAKILQGKTVDFDALFSAQLRADEVLRSDIMKRLASGDTGGIAPEKFVSTFMEGADNQTVRDAMAKIQATNPALAEGVERSVLVDLFRKAGRAPDRRFPPTEGQAWQLADPNNLRHMLETNRPKLEAALSPATLEKLEQFSQVLNAGAISDTVAGAGKLAAGHDMAQLLKFPNEGGGLFGALHRNFNALALATLLTSKSVEKWWGNQAMRQLPINERWAMLFYLTPAITDQLSQFGEEEAAVIGQALNESMARTMRSQQLMQQQQQP